MVSLPDQSQGTGVASLESELRRADCGAHLENAIVVFASDHGDALGDKGHIQKWAMYDSVTRVPLILCGSGLPKNERRDAPVQLMDVAPTLLDYAGITVPENWETHPMRSIIEENSPGRSCVYAELGRDHIQTGAEYLVMRRDTRWKLVWYLGAQDGELYDLVADPAENQNLWFSAQHQNQRDSLVSQTKDWSIAGMLNSKKTALRNPQTKMAIGKP